MDEENLEPGELPSFILEKLKTIKEEPSDLQIDYEPIHFNGFAMPKLEPMETESGHEQRRTYKPHPIRYKKKGQKDCSFCGRRIKWELKVNLEPMNFSLHCICELCFQHFPSERSYRLHQRTCGRMPIKDEKLTCDKCPFTCYSRDALQKHVVKHCAGKKPKIKCMKCSYVCQSNDELLLHMKTHLDQLEREVLQYKQKLKAIEPILTSQPRNVAAMTTVIKAEPEKTQTRSGSALTTVIKADPGKKAIATVLPTPVATVRPNKIGLDPKVKVKVESPYTCKICENEFIKTHDYWRHLKSCDKKCECCGEEFDNRDDKNIHREKHKDVWCYECAKSFDDLPKHKLVVHSRYNHIVHTVPS